MWLDYVKVEQSSKQMRKAGKVQPWPPIRKYDDALVAKREGNLTFDFCLDYSSFCSVHSHQPSSSGRGWFFTPLVESYSYSEFLFTTKTNIKTKTKKNYVFVSPFKMWRMWILHSWLVVIFINYDCMKDSVMNATLLVSQMTEISFTKGQE